MLAAALTAGLAAYFVGLLRLGVLDDNRGIAVVNSPQTLKDFMSTDATWSRADLSNEYTGSPELAPRPGIWNRADLEQDTCVWNPNQAANRFKRQQQSVTGSCFIPEPTSSSPIATSSFVACTTQQPDPDSGIAEGYCVCSGSTFAQSTDASATPANVCAYTSPLPPTTTSISTIATVPFATTSSKPSPTSSNLYDVFPSPPYSTPVVHCGVFDDFTAAAGTSLSEATNLITNFCGPPGNTPLLWLIAWL